jgi:hypothetical protein
MSNTNKDKEEDCLKGMVKAVDIGFKKFLKKRGIETPKGFNYSKTKEK